ncbi:MAG: type II secretory pathway, ATPase PulE/Tfp pilus assembly pathway, ATPase PilB [Candidatus Woesebacteria bacterium GW2011_GWA1_39_8]|uniref:Type II secretory pathway, ATPase PulE/Tfp pilus assembly pathway, ATPase PilB n=1 Tax=Candidatus Woesebacteria bacterium GW2011_GWA1_39_8 TaxID=1618552 RepID=A0A0G0PKB7_9BACT|nr:MAG: type II secretory pathway, ATPase PulE/Tfp pilus assembly pathway, ATPase PilB [Candidatus Woesebacteria bacterium GW2011_GWA1_39_8]
MPALSPTQSTIVDILVSEGFLDEQKGKAIRLEEVQSGKPQEQILLERKLINETQLTQAKAKLYNVPFLDLNTTPVSPEALSKLPQEVAQRFRVFPVSLDELAKQIVVAMADPLDLTAIEFIEQKTGLTVRPYASEPSKIETLIAAGYTTTLAHEVSEALKEVGPDKSPLRTLDATKTGIVRQEKIAEIVTYILSFAIKSRASDVHIEPQEKSTRVRYRIDGILQEKLTIPRELHDALVSRIKILSGMKIDEKRIPQDGRFNFKSEDQEVDLRVSTLPTSWGEKIVTLEDPIEYKIAGVNQVQVNPGAGLTFASGLRSFLRQDPNIILVGEIRDQETADLAVQASLTGHLVFSTLHTNDASGALPRLLDMGAEPYLLASSITAIVAQRVVRKIHDECKTPYVPELKVVEQIKAALGPLWRSSNDVKLYKGRGDPKTLNAATVGIMEGSVYLRYCQLAKKLVGLYWNAVLQVL